MKKLLALLLLLLFIILLWLSWKWYKNTVVCCDDTLKVEVQENSSPEETNFEPLAFNWGSAEAQTNEPWPEQKNEILAFERANAIKALLVASGIEASRVTVSSLGQENPIATNDTEEGRQKNRRIELEIK